MDKTCQSPSTTKGMAASTSDRHTGRHCSLRGTLPVPLSNPSRNRKPVPNSSVGPTISVIYACLMLV